MINLRDQKKKADNVTEGGLRVRVDQKKEKIMEQKNETTAQLRVIIEITVATPTKLNKLN